MARHGKFIGTGGSKHQKIVNLALPKATILRCQRIDAGIDADVTDKEIRTLDKVRDLISGSPAETTNARWHRRTFAV